ncbi:MAG TPA: TIGR03435 family protein [Bryobacteraceae bacterium]
MRAFIAFVMAGAVALGQSASPAFEVASIKPHEFGGAGGGGGRLGISISGSLVTCSIMTLSRLIIEAYGVKAYQVSGGPTWASDSSTVFDIEARADGTPTREQADAMLQTLLADRFHVKLHREMKDLPVYDLVIAKNGPKLKESAADATSMSSRQGSPTGPRKLTFSKATITVLANGLAADAGRPVIDKTGLTGSYNFSLEYTPDGTPADVATGPSIFTALEDQLGLKLVSSKAPTEILVIDHAEKPTQN